MAADQLKDSVSLFSRYQADTAHVLLALLFDSAVGEEFKSPYLLWGKSFFVVLGIFFGLN